MADVHDTPPATATAKHTYRILMSEIIPRHVDVEATSLEEARDLAETIPDSEWNVGDSDFEIDDVVRLDVDGQDQHPTR